LQNIQEAKASLLQLKDKNKFEKMLYTAVILTDLLQQYDINPIIVGGLSVEDKSVFIIGIEDIILDRLRSAVHWKSGVDREWGFRLLLMYYEKLNLDYIQDSLRHTEDEVEFKRWLNGASLEKNEINDDDL
jgi:hypothetical protein